MAINNIIKSNQSILDDDRTIVINADYNNTQTVGISDPVKHVIKYSVSKCMELNLL
jgi:hypothetical protein